MQLTCEFLNPEQFTKYLSDIVIYICEQYFYTYSGVGRLNWSLQASNPSPFTNYLSVSYFTRRNHVEYNPIGYDMDISEFLNFSFVLPSTCSVSSFSRISLLRLEPSVVVYGSAILQIPMSRF